MISLEEPDWKMEDIENAAKISQNGRLLWRAQFPAYGGCVAGIKPSVPIIFSTFGYPCSPLEVALPSVFFYPTPKVNSLRLERVSDNPRMAFYGTTRLTDQKSAGRIKVLYFPDSAIFPKKLRQGDVEGSGRSIPLFGE